MTADVLGLCFDLQTRKSVALPDDIRAGFAVLLVTGEEERKPAAARSEEHTSELQSLMRISYAVFCLKKKTKYTDNIVVSMNLGETYSRDGIDTYNYIASYT